MPAQLLRISIKSRVSGEYGLPKHAVSELRVAADGAEGDYNHYRTRSLHGDPDQAILLVTDEVLQQLRTEGWPVEPGDLGENLTLGGVAEATLVPGTRVQVGSVVLEVTKPCDPCTELGSLAYVGKQRQTEFIRTTLGRRGWYARVLVPGAVTLASPLAVQAGAR